MNIVDRYLLRKGYNLDGSPMKKTKKKKWALYQKKKNLNTERTLADKKNVIALKYKKWKIEDR